MTKCNQCGLNTTHSSNYHDSWSPNLTSFKLPTTNYYAKECAQLAAQKSNHGSGSFLSASAQSFSSGSCRYSCAGIFSLSQLKKTVCLRMYIYRSKWFHCHQCYQGPVFKLAGHRMTSLLPFYLQYLLFFSFTVLLHVWVPFLFHVIISFKMPLWFHLIYWCV